MKTVIIPRAIALELMEKHLTDDCLKLWKASTDAAKVQIIAYNNLLCYVLFEHWLVCGSKDYARTLQQILENRIMMIKPRFYEKIEEFSARFDFKFDTYFHETIENAINNWRK